MLIIKAFLLALVTASGAVRQAESDALRQTAPTYLAGEGKAALHLAGSTLAGALFSIDPELLLAIAYRESRYTLGVAGPEVRGRRACGLMQPLMHAGRCREQTVLGGYLEGANHFRAWLDTSTCRGDVRCALLGYSGGYSLLKGCAIGPVVVERNGKHADLCKLIPGSTLARAEAIRSRLKHAQGST
jgi:hypothetical protein